MKLANFLSEFIFAKGVFAVHRFSGHKIKGIIKALLTGFPPALGPFPDASVFWATTAIFYAMELARNPPVPVRTSMESTTDA